MIPLRPVIIFRADGGGKLSRKILTWTQKSITIYYEDHIVFYKKSSLCYLNPIQSYGRVGGVSGHVKHTVCVLCIYVSLKKKKIEIDFFHSTNQYKFNKCRQE